MPRRGEEHTYRAATPNGVVAAAGADMFFVITGGTTREVRVRKLRVTGPLLTTLEVETIVAEKWSSAPTGGTATALTVVPLDSTQPATGATLVQVYTAAPTQGTLIGTVAARRGVFKSSTVVDGAPFFDTEFIFGDLPETKPIILRSAAQALSLAFGAAPATAVTLDVEVEWTEPGS